MTINMDVSCAVVLGNPWLHQSPYSSPWDLLRGRRVRRPTPHAASGIGGGYASNEESDSNGTDADYPYTPMQALESFKLAFVKAQVGELIEAHGAQ